MLRPVEAFYLTWISTPIMMDLRPEQNWPLVPMSTKPQVFCMEAGLQCGTKAVYLYLG